jgi:2-dehydro-3-deoxy-D-pentonate aldolase
VNQIAAFLAIPGGTTWPPSNSWWLPSSSTRYAGGTDGSICAFANVAPELFVNLVHSARDDNLQRAAELHRCVLSLVTLGGYSDPPISAIKLAMNKLGVPISPVVRGPALPIREEAHEKVESVLREVGLPTVREVG